MRRFVSNPALRLAAFTGISSLVITFAGGYFYSVLSKNENVTVRYVAGALAVATLVGVLSSRARHGRHISTLQTIITVAVTPFIAFCTFIVTYFIISMFDIEHHTPAVDVSIFALAFTPVLIIVRWSVHLLCGLKKPS
jgi:hypothetical protein